MEMETKCLLLQTMESLDTAAMKPSSSIQSSLQGDAVHEAMALMVEDCMDYLKAAETAPDVVLEESPPHQFLSFCQGNMSEAAERLALYWKTRVYVFGEQDAFLPLTQALRTHDFDLLERGESLVSGPDHQGRMIQFFDESYCDPNKFSKNELLRTYFIFLGCLQRQCFQSNCSDVVFVLQWSSNNMQYQWNKDRNAVAFVKQLTGKALCFRSVQVHLIASPLHHGLYKSFLRIRLPSIVQSISERLASVPIFAHVGTQDEILDSLQEHDVRACDLPASIGGSWTSAEAGDGDVVFWLKLAKPNAIRAESRLVSQEEKTAQGEAMDADTGSFCAEIMEMPIDHWEEIFRDTQGFELEKIDDVEACRVRLPDPSLVDPPRSTLKAAPPIYVDQDYSASGPELRKSSELDAVTSCQVLSFGGEQVSKADESKSDAVWLHDRSIFVSRSSFGNILGGDWLVWAMRTVKDNAAFCQAMERAPDVVQAESPPAHFLSFCSGDAISAASRLALYWSLRVKIFEGEKAFLPISKALSADELVRAQVGTTVILPDANSEGMPTMLMDLSRARFDDFDVAVSAREMFFMLQCICSICRERKLEEYVSVFRWTQYSHGLVQQESSPALALLIRDGLCARPKRFDIVGVFPAGTDKKFWSTLVPAIVSRFHDQHEETMLRITVHAGTQSEVVKSLREHGYAPEKFPTTMGGRWTYEHDLPKWLESQVGFALPKRKILPAEAPSSAAIQKADLSKLGMQSSGVSRVSHGHHVKRAMPGSRRAKQRITGERKTRRTREQNIIYSRRKREKEKMRLDQLKGSASSLRSENSELRLEEARLQNLIAQAKVLASKDVSSRFEKSDPVHADATAVLSVMPAEMEPPMAHYNMESLRQRQEALANERVAGTSSSSVGGRRRCEATSALSLRSVGSTSVTTTLSDFASGSDVTVRGSERNSIAGQAPPAALQPSTFLQLLRHRIHELRR